MLSHSRVTSKASCHRLCRVLHIPPAPLLELNLPYDSTSQTQQPTFGPNYLGAAADAVVTIFAGHCPPHQLHSRSRALRVCGRRRAAGRL